MVHSENGQKLYFMVVNKNLDSSETATMFNKKFPNIFDKDNKESKDNQSPSAGSQAINSSHLKSPETMITVIIPLRGKN